MKKIISLLAAVAMMSTMCVLPASAATEVTVATTKTEISLEEYNTATWWDGATWSDGSAREALSGDYDCYKLTVDLSGFGTISSTLSGRPGQQTFAGRQLVNFTYDLKFDDVSKIHKANAAGSGYMNDAYDYMATLGNAAGAWALNGDPIYTTAFNSAYPGATATSVTDDLQNVVAYYFAIEKGSEATITLGGSVAFQEYANSQAATGAIVDKAVVTYAPATITIGEAGSAVVPVTGVEVTPETATLTVDETVALTAAVEPAEATNKAVTWSSNDDSIASVSAEGVVTAKAPGEATITATTADGSFTDTCEVTVNAKTVPATGVTITNAPETAVEIGYTTTLVATVDPDNTTDTLVWSSDATDIVEIDAATGAIVAKAAGSAVITATCGTATDTVTITVNEPAPPAFDFVVGTCKAIDAGTKKGFVWVANKMLNVNTAEKSYTAVFSTTADGEKSVALDLSAVETTGTTIVFDAALTTDKLNVDFDVKEN